MRLDLSFGRGLMKHKLRNQRTTVKPQGRVAQIHELQGQAAAPIGVNERGRGNDKADPPVTGPAQHVPSKIRGQVNKLQGCGKHQLVRMKYKLLAKDEVAAKLEAAVLGSVSAM